MVIIMIEERLSDIRFDANLTQIEMAKVLKTSQANYSRWESNKELIPLKKLNLLCNHFNVSMDYVIGITKNNKGTGIHNLDNKLVGNNLRTVRKNNNITQLELANMLNTTHSTISAYESGKTKLLTVFAIEIVKKYNISLDWLCGRID